MLESVSLQNFISHRDTNLKFDNGLTLFIGHNGAGKSSIIDAVTFALYGQHTRKSSKNLVKRGSSGSLVEVEMSVRGRKFRVVRGLNASGQLINAKLTELKPDGHVDIVIGERKQFAESVAEEVTKVLGLDYSKLRVAAVVQQGELNAIIQSQPKEFKELINSLFGLDRLDLAYQSMRELIQQFRIELRRKIGYDDSELSVVKERLQDARKSHEEAWGALNSLVKEKESVSEKVRELDESIRGQEPLYLKVNELASKESDLLNYIRNKRKEIEEELSNVTQLVSDAKRFLLVVKDKEEVARQLERLRASVSTIDSRLEDTSNDIGRIKALMEVSDKLQITDGKCPICKSPVEKIDAIYDVRHLERDLEEKKRQQKEMQSEKDDLKLNERKCRKRELEISNAESFLQRNKISDTEDLAILEKDIAEKKSVLKNIPTDFKDVNDPQEFAIDDYSRELALKILHMRKETQSFDNVRYEYLKKEHRKLLGKDLPKLEEKIGAYKEQLKQAEIECSKMENAIEALKKAGVYVRIFEKIRNSVFNRDGMVGMSLRTWALKTISQKASEYTAMFNMSISRLQLTEKARDITIECYGRSGAIDMESLSGGEKVAIALALRLGIAYVMGSGKLDFVILDEPTTHLDEERRKSLVRIITEAFRSELGPLSQMIIITHDSEIFEDAEVDSVYKFSITNEGTLVTRV